VATDWSALPGWNDDSVVHAWPALLRSCEKPSADWAATCQAARALQAANGGADEARVRSFLRERLQPWRVETAEGAAEGLITGYFEPLIEGSLKRSSRFSVPLHAPPADLASRRPWFSRAEIAQLPAAQAALRGREVAWVADPLDAFVLQVQGSGRLALAQPDGQRQVVRVAFAGHNDQPFRSPARWLVEQGAFTLEQASWPAIKDWARANPRRVPELLNVNPRYVFFRQEALSDATVGPLGAQGVPLTPGRSIAVDKDSVPYGTPVWIATTEPQPWSPTAPPPRPLERLVVAQDTGGAIIGAVRADYFWGWSEGAEERAGRMKQPLRMWVLWPRG
jgi:membrane-bound lytic murein transglycosylase A